MKKLTLFLIIIIIFSIFITSGCNTLNNKFTFNGELKMEEEGELKILMLTDIHLTAGIYKTVEEMRAAGKTIGPVSGITAYQRDQWALQTVAHLINTTKPNLIVVTGDMVYTNKNSQFFNPAGHSDNLKAMKQFAEFMESFEIPWAPVFGNHDHEGDYSREEIADYLITLTYCVFEKGPSDISGYGNYVINIINSDDTHNTSLILLDSNSYREENFSSSGYDCIHDDQIVWYEQQLNSVQSDYNLDTLPQSLLFFHIPVKETKTVRQLYKKGVNDSEFTFYEGVIAEEANIPTMGNYKDKYYDGGNIFDKIVELQSTKAIFVGHDHINNFIAKYKDVLMVNGKSIDYVAYLYPDICTYDTHRGGTLITLKDKQDFVYDGEENKPVELIPFEGGFYKAYVAANK